jgi:hypothetical protein
MQFNHIYADSTNQKLYTNLCNIVVTPAFIAKLTDKQVRPHLHYRAYELYGFAPYGSVAKPANYDDLIWAETLPPVNDIEAVLRNCMRTKPKDRTIISAKTLGWYFSGFVPDSSIGV